MRHFVTDFSSLIGLFPFDKSGHTTTFRLFYSVAVVLIVISVTLVAKAFTFSTDVFAKSLYYNVANVLHFVQITSSLVHLRQMNKYGKTVTGFIRLHAACSREIPYFRYNFSICWGVLMLSVVFYGISPLRQTFDLEIFTFLLELDNFINLIISLQFSLSVVVATKSLEYRGKLPAKNYITLGEGLSLVLKSLNKIYGPPLLLIYITTFGWIVWEMCSIYLLFHWRFEIAWKIMFWLSISFVQKLMSLFIPCVVCQRYSQKVGKS